jgi:hypothetical protein
MFLFLFICIFTYAPLAVDSSSQVHPVVCHKHKCLKVSCCHNKCFDDHSIVFRLDFIFCYMFQFSWDHHQAVTYDTYRVIEPLIWIHIWIFGYLQCFILYNVNCASDYNMSIKIKVIDVCLVYVLEKIFKIDNFYIKKC